MNVLGWGGIARLGLVQAMLGAVVVLTTSTLNRVMVVELALPALVPGLLVALHYAVQASRPRMGFGSDRGSRRTPWIVGGQIVLASGGFLAALGTSWMATRPVAGMALAVVAFVLVGLGVSAAGTSLLALLAKRVDPSRRAAAAATVWTMMIVGFAVTAGVAGRFLDPYSPARLVAVSATVSAVAVLVTLIALWRLEGHASAPARAAEDTPMTATRFRDALVEVWREPDARRFTVFVFVSMLAYSAQDLILEPFAGDSPPARRRSWPVCSTPARSRACCSRRSRVAVWPVSASVRCAHGPSGAASRRASRSPGLPSPVSARRRTGRCRPTCSCSVSRTVPSRSPPSVR